MKKRNKKGSRWQDRDPEFEREKGRYKEPIPSRALILQTLEAASGPMRAEELIESLGLAGDSLIEAFRARLGAMVRDGQLAQNRRGAFGATGDMHLLAGRVIAHRDGYGFVTPETGGSDIFLPPPQMRSVMSGDKVLVRAGPEDHRGRREGVLVEVLERGNRTVVGRLVVEQDVAYIVPENPRVHHDVLIPPESRKGAKAGQMVVVEIIVDPGARTMPVGKVIDVLGQHLAPGMEIEAAIRAHGLPHEWPQAVLREAAALPDEVSGPYESNRLDLRELPLLTIDGADARDFDDAVYCEPRRGGKGWKLWVAIADVAAYVQPDSPLDREAQERGNSVYFPERVIPMLPEKLSNGLCSLNPDVDRLCMVCEMEINGDGAVTRSRFHEAVMRSQARCTYDEVYTILENPKGPEAQRRGKLVKHLQALDALFGALSGARKARGTIDFETVETKIVFGAQRKIEKIVPVQRNRAHKIIEECMIAANVQAARFVEKHKLPSLFRVHAPPDSEKVAALRDFLSARGLKLGGGAEPAPADFARVAEQSRGRSDAAAIQTMLLRTMMQARYESANAGHFGLALDEYAHFTSPIRRYPDLLLHRAIRHVLRKQPRKQYRYDLEKLDALGTHCSMTERRADEATRDVVTWLKCEYMKDRVGETFAATVTGVAAFGLFCELDGLYVEGLVHVSALYNDYYDFDPQRLRMVGSRNGRVYAFGDRLRVKVTRVSLDERKIDLEPVQERVSGSRSDSGQKKSSGTRGKRKRKSR